MTGVTGNDDDTDGVLVALDGLSTAVKDNIHDERRLIRTIDRLRAGRAEGRTWRDLLAGDDGPGVLRQASTILRRLTDAAAGLRHSLARALRAEGATIPVIAGLFGVSHQRVSALLRRGGRQPPT